MELQACTGFHLHVAKRTASRVSHNIPQHRHIETFCMPQPNCALVTLLCSKLWFMQTGASSCGTGAARSRASFLINPQVRLEASFVL